MGIDPDRPRPELTQPDPVARHAETVIALVIALTVAQIKATQTILGHAGQIVMH